jgi:hypothetical protein
LHTLVPNLKWLLTGSAVTLTDATVPGSGNLTPAAAAVLGT